MDRYPQMFRVWVTKQVSGFNGLNRQLSRIRSDVVNECPCCGHKDESTSHLTRCTNPSRRKVFQQSVDKLLDWLEDTGCDVRIVECFEAYFLQYGEAAMVEIASDHPHLSRWAMEVDTLGWDNLVEGRIGYTLLDIQARLLKEKGSFRHIKAWATELIQHLLGLSHRQWIYRNARTHIRVLEGKSESEHDSIIEQVGKLLLTDPETLLPQHRCLLDIDFEQLGSGTTANQQYWLAKLESAISAFQHINARVITNGSING